jgi:8-oxo-dGTP pyrophosphatase MutT (NUDIX family)
VTSAMAGGDDPLRQPATRQVIPRPRGAVRAVGATWKFEPRCGGISLASVREALSGRGVAARDDGGPLVFDAPENLPRVPAAVLVALFEAGGEAHVVLTRRASHLRTHTGEVAFPGGRLELGERPEAGALREAAEEVGLDPRLVELVGRLQARTTLSSGTIITPVVGFLAGRPSLSANPTEVERVFTVSLAELAADGVCHEERWPVDVRLRSSDASLAPIPRDRRALAEEWYPVWFFELDADTVWGATARILVELLTLVLGPGTH